MAHVASVMFPSWAAAPSAFYDWRSDMAANPERGAHPADDGVDARAKDAGQVPFKLEVGVCDQRRSYIVGFADEGQVMEFIARRKEQDEAWRESTGAAPWSGGHAYHELEEYPIPDGWDRLYDFLNPTCDHGLSAYNCAGYGHYPQDHPAYA